jgi:hypothetical protein
MPAVAILQEYKHKNLQKWLSNNAKAFMKDFEFTYLFLCPRFKKENFCGVRMEVVKKIDDTESHVLHAIKIGRIEPLAEAFREAVVSEEALHFADVAFLEMSELYDIELVDHMRLCMDTSFKLYLYQNVFVTKENV